MVHELKGGKIKMVKVFTKGFPAMWRENSVSFVLLTIQENQSWRCQLLTHHYSICSNISLN